MASIIIVLGSVLGFATALVGWVALDFSLLTALSIWIGSGPLAAVLAMALGGPARESPSKTGDRTLAEA